MKRLHWMWRLFKVWDQEQQLPPRAGLHFQMLHHMHSAESADRAVDIVIAL